MPAGKVLSINMLTNYTVDETEGAVGHTREDEYGNIYKWVKNSTGGALVANRAYCYGTLLLTTGYRSGWEIFTLGQSGKGTVINLMAGLAMSAAPADYFCWIQVAGYNANGPVEGTSAVAASDNLKMVSGQTYLVKDVAAGTAPTNRYGARAVVAQAAASVVATPIFLDCQHY
jgi:hypothetical protein